MSCHKHRDRTAVTTDEALAALEAGVLENPWALATWKKIRGSLSTAPRVYRQLDPKNFSGTILCDPEEFSLLVAPFKKAKTVPLNCGFKTYQAFYTWQSNMHRFFELASGQREYRSQLRERRDAGSTFLSAISIGADGQPIYSGSELVPIDSFIRICREDGIDLNEATPDWVKQKIKSSSANQAASIRKAAARIDALRGSGSVPVEVLPPLPFGDLSSAEYAGKWRTPPVHPDFAEARDRYLKQLLTGSKLARLGTASFSISTHDRIGKSRAKSIRQSLDWFHHGLVALGISQTNKALPWNRLAEPKLLLDIAELDAAGSLNRRTQADTRGRRIRDVVGFMDSQISRI